MEAFIAWIEKNIMPGANKLASERHLKAIRDTFMTIRLQFSLAALLQSLILLQ